MCLICAAIPAVAAAGANWNAGQYRKEKIRHFAVPKIAVSVIGLLIIALAGCHMLRWQG
jgi:hypothetical protein